MNDYDQAERAGAFDNFVAWQIESREQSDGHVLVLDAFEMVLIDREIVYGKESIVRISRKLDLYEIVQAAAVKSL